MQQLRASPGKQRAEPRNFRPVPTAGDFKDAFIVFSGARGGERFFRLFRAPSRGSHRITGNSMALSSKTPDECRILIVDDEKSVCDLLKDVLDGRYDVTVCYTGAEACALMERGDFDVVVTDLRLPDISGLAVMERAKGRDPYTEVLLITGFASLESATEAINIGAISYVEKPLSLADFQVQIEKAVASRLFHLKCLTLLRNSAGMAPEFKDHLSDITSLYYFTRKLTLSLDVAEIMRITLDEALRKSGGHFCAIGVDVLGFREIYAMSRAGDLPEQQVQELLAAHWKAAFPFLDQEQYRAGKIGTIIYKGRQGPPPRLDGARVESIPLLITGNAIGSLVLFFAQEGARDGVQDFLTIVSSIVSPLIEHGYMVLQARQLAKTDGLTGIANHRAFHEALDREIARANRRSGVFSLILLDIDDFKKINDARGHLVGDAVIRDLVRRVRESIRSVDLFARYGGEEFGLILPDTDRRGAEILARRILEAVHVKPFVYGQNAVPYTVSMGISIFDTRRAVKKDVLIDQADAAMYASKRGGKNRVSVSEACV